VTDPNTAIERVLAVAAHPDDTEFGFGGTVAKLVADGASVTYVVCTDGSQGGEDPSVPDEELTAIRYREQQAAAEVLGVGEVRFLGYPDGHLQVDLEFRRRIVAEIRRARPDLILTHSPHRRLTMPMGVSHPDHLAVGETTLQAVYPDARNPRAFRDLLSQGLEPHRVREIWMPAGGDGDHVVDITDHVEKKIDAVYCHASQLGARANQNGHGDWIRERARRNGERFGVEYAEVFERLAVG
jgi:LmbE family N-acetylglucosaminyl deacetylase